ncbi:MAG: response regulator transcription factor [Promicromonosporaceae bacterium]|nr:response regulator transcription factor [Promicromonosporaceae bacterium]
MTRILVVEDEESYRDPLTFQLAREGFEVLEASTGPEALARFAEAGANLVLLDLMLPGLPGTEVCRQIRAKSDVPIIMITAKDTEIDKVVGLELGADDYLTKPYSFRELLARIRAVLRRRAPEAAINPASPSKAEAADDVLAVGPIRLDVDRHKVTINGVAVKLPLKEFGLLECLMTDVGRVLTRGQLIDQVWGSDYFGDTKTLDVHVKRLRAKIEPDPAHPRYLLTVRGLGYRLADEDA